MAGGVLQSAVPHQRCASVLMLSNGKPQFPEASTKSETTPSMPPRSVWVYSFSSSAMRLLTSFLSHSGNDADMAASSTVRDSARGESTFFNSSGLDWASENSPLDEGDMPVITPGASSGANAPAKATIVTRRGSLLAQARA